MQQIEEVYPQILENKSRELKLRYYGGGGAGGGGGDGEK